MKRTKKPFVPGSPTAWETLRYIQAELAGKVKWPNDFDEFFMTVNIGLGCPDFPVEVVINSPALNRQAVQILKALGIPSTLVPLGKHQDSIRDYLSIPLKSLDDFRNANNEKILEWSAASRGRGGDAA